MNYSFNPANLFVNGLPQFPKDEEPLAIYLYRLWIKDKLPVIDALAIARYISATEDLPPELGVQLFWYQMAKLNQASLPPQVRPKYNYHMELWREWIVAEFDEAISPWTTFAEVADSLLQKIDNHLLAH